MYLKANLPEFYPTKHMHCYLKSPFMWLTFIATELHCMTYMYSFDFFREEFSLLNAAFQIIRGGVIPLDIATVETGDGGKCFMSLLGNWGLVADVDIESEKFRKIGETRFVLGEHVFLMDPAHIMCVFACVRGGWGGLYHVVGGL